MGEVHVVHRGVHVLHQQRGHCRGQIQDHRPLLGQTGSRPSYDLVTQNLLRTCELKPWFLYTMVAHFRLRAYDVKKFFFRKKIGFNDSFDVTKCVKQLGMPDLLHVCAQ